MVPTERVNPKMWMISRRGNDHSLLLRGFVVTSYASINIFNYLSVFALAFCTIVLGYASCRGGAVLVIFWHILTGEFPRKPLAVKS